jgi:hypothetical protein
MKSKVLLLPNKMYKLFCILILLLTCRIAYAQDTLKYPKLIFKVAPLNFLDPLSFRSAQVGFEYRFAPKYSVDFSYGQIFGKESLGNSKGTGFKAKSEIRRYLNNKRLRKLSRYLALEGFYHKVDYPSGSSFEDTVTATIYSEDYFIKKDLWGLNIKCGFEVCSVNRFIIDIFGGIGFRVKYVRHLDRARPEDEFHTVDVTAANVRDQEGKYAVFNLSLGFKIGYIIK